MSTGFSFEEFCRVPLSQWLQPKKEEIDEEFVWFKGWLTLPDGREQWGVIEKGLERYDKLTPFQRLVFDRLDYSFQIIAKDGTEDDWLKFVKENLTHEQRP